jgi:hypothetical protein
MDARQVTETSAVNGRPHIVISHTIDGAATFSGPYPTRSAAERAAELEHRLELDAGGGGEITFAVAPLSAPV